MKIKDDYDFWKSFAVAAGLTLGTGFAISLVFLAWLAMAGMTFSAVKSEVDKQAQRVGHGLKLRTPDPSKTNTVHVPPGSEDQCYKAFSEDDKGYRRCLNGYTITVQDK